VLKEIHFNFLDKKLIEPINEAVPYVIKGDINLRMMFVSDLKRGGNVPTIKINDCKNLRN
jgi:hypothetical protein